MATTRLRKPFTLVLLQTLALCGCGTNLVTPSTPSERAGAGISTGGAVRETVLYNFRGRPDGWNPWASLVMDGTGALYGTTLIGGSCRTFYYGCGTVFKLTPSGTRYSEETIYRFAGTPDGEASTAPLTIDARGRLYGTTYAGGNIFGMGTVFRLTPSKSGYTETVLHQFTGFPQDGATPYSGVALDKNGNIYGTTYYGGAHQAGSIYKLTPSRGGYTESVLYSFGTQSADGAEPNSTLVLDANGTVYGTAGYAIFKVVRSGSRYTETTLYRLRGRKDGNDASGTLLIARDGALYGTAQNRGPGGCGTVFRLTPKGSTYSFRLLHVFNCSRNFQDGAFPAAGVVADGSGALYGTTYNGGYRGCAVGCGVVFKITRTGESYVESVVYSFKPKTDGDQPFGGLIESHGALFGTTSFGGRSGASIFGTVFELTNQH